MDISSLHTPVFGTSHSCRCTLFHVVDSSEQLGTFKDFIKTFPEIDTPEIFGLHPNADLTFRVKEVNALFGTLGNTQPKVRFHIARVLFILPLAARQHHGRCSLQWKHRENGLIQSSRVVLP